MLADLESAPTVLLLILLAGVFAAALWIAVNALRRTDDVPARHAPVVGKVVEGPALRDGIWCRLVAFPDGHRRVEVLGPKGWVASHRNVEDLLQAIPGRSGAGRPPA